MRIKYISKEKALSYKKKTIDWIDLLDGFVDSRKQAMKVPINSPKNNIGHLKILKKKYPRLDMFSKNIDGKCYLIVIKKGMFT